LEVRMNADQTVAIRWSSLMAAVMILGFNPEASWIQDEFLRSMRERDDTHV